MSFALSVRHSAAELAIGNLSLSAGRFSLFGLDSGFSMPMGTIDAHPEGRPRV
jgi:hypothetical protein